MGNERFVCFGSRLRNLCGGYFRASTLNAEMKKVNGLKVKIQVNTEDLWY